MRSRAQRLRDAAEGVWRNAVGVGIGGKGRVGLAVFLQHDAEVDRRRRGVRTAGQRAAQGGLRAPQVAPVLPHQSELDPAVVVLRMRAEQGFQRGLRGGQVAQLLLRDGQVQARLPAARLQRHGPAEGAGGLGLAPERMQHFAPLEMRARDVAVQRNGAVQRRQRGLLFAAFAHRLRQFDPRRCKTRCSLDQQAQFRHGIGRAAAQPGDAGEIAWLQGIAAERAGAQQMRQRLCRRAIGQRRPAGYQERGQVVRAQCESLRDMAPRQRGIAALQGNLRAQLANGGMRRIAPHQRGRITGGRVDVALVQLRDGRRQSGFQPGMRLSGQRRVGSALHRSRLGHGKRRGCGGASLTGLACRRHAWTCFSQR